MSIQDYFISFLDKQQLVKKFPQQFIFFMIVGGLSYFIDMAILIFLVEIIKLNIIVSTGLSFIIVAVINYLLNIKYIFINGKYKKAYELIGFLILGIICLFFTIFLMKFFVYYLKIWYVYSKTITVLLVSIFSFSFRKWLLFKK